MDTVTRQMVDLFQIGMTLEVVGKKFGMTRQGVRYRFIQAGIPRRKKVTYKDIDKQQLEKLYFQGCRRRFRLRLFSESDK